jgi:hypothetical protein
MGSCIKCGSTLVAQARFCAACGNPVVHASVIPPATRPRSIVHSSPDPYAKTVRRDEQDDPGEPPAPAPVSPLAASVMATKSSVPPVPPLPPRAAESQVPQRAASQAPAPPPQLLAPPQPPAQSFHAFVTGTLVLVSWADGNRYPGTVLQVAPHHVFVAFPNGMQQWIDARYVTAGG